MSALRKTAALGATVGFLFLMQGTRDGFSLPAAPWNAGEPSSAKGLRTIVPSSVSPVSSAEAGPLIAQAQAQPRTPAPPPAASPNAAASDGDAPDVDITALRYFAQQGDTRRLEAEIARLRALYPNWQPPENPLEVQAAGDPELDRIWQLYSQGRYAEVREAIATREGREPGWTPPADLLTRLDVAEARAQLVNASNLQQSATVIRLATEQPSLLTCSEVDVLWRVARAFIDTERPDRGRDAYLYVLSNCEDSGERLATMQMASQFLPRADLDPLLAAERTNADGVGEFAAVRADLARQSLARAANDASVTVPAADLDTMRRLVESDASASDLELLGWYELRRDAFADALRHFERARQAGDTSSISQGYALSLLRFGRFAEAEIAMVPWRDTSDGARAVYLAAAANLLSARTGQPIEAEVLGRIVPAVSAARDAAAAQQLGWYAFGLNQFTTAAQWFTAALGWKADDEQSAYGLALVRQRLGDADGVALLQRQWGARSPRIAAIGRPDQAEIAAAQAARETSGGPPQAVVAAVPGAAPAQAMAQPMTTGMAPPDAMRPPAQLPPAATAYAPPVVREAALPAEPAPTRRGALVRSTQPASAPVAASSARGRATSCAANGRDPSVLSPEAAMAQGWCLLDLDRSLEAAAFFESAARRGEGRIRQDAAYGESLAYLRLGVSDRASIAASRSPQPAQRRVELDVAILSARATSAYEAKRPVETLQALDERARLAPERNDLMVLRGFAYLELRRYGDAERVFSAVARTGSREGARGLEAVRQALGRYPNGG